MKSIDRIKRITELLKELWEHHPDQRFGQLLINEGLFPDTYDIWSREDDVFEAMLRNMIRQRRRRK